MLSKQRFPLTIKDTQTKYFCPNISNFLDAQAWWYPASRGLFLFPTDLGRSKRPLLTGCVVVVFQD